MSTSPTKRNSPSKQLVKQSDETTPTEGSNKQAIDDDDDDADAEYEQDEEAGEKVKIEYIIQKREILPLPPGPVDRDVCFGEPSHQGTMQLMDLIRVHYVIMKKSRGDAELPSTEGEVEALATHLTTLMLEGKKIELSGLKDVPKPFLIGEGRFFQRSEEEWERLSSDQAKALVAKTILAQYQEIDSKNVPFSADLEECVQTLFKNSDPATRDPDEPSIFSAPRPCDVLFLPIEYNSEDNMPYEHQSGNKHLLFLASQHIAADTNDTSKRVEAAFKLVTSKIEVNVGTELLQKTPRYVAQELRDKHNAWRELTKEELAEFACIFTFEVYLEKQIHGMGFPLSSQVTNPSSDTAKPGTVPIETPTQYDVLFGRGGMTNGHPGNRRFRDIIALHRPDYIRATKMDKPNVARRIVRAIRQGSPPGRFLKKNDDGKWYDVGDRCAAEKTSQGLRERSNAEKRQRSALREALRIRREDLEGEKEEDRLAKKAKTEASSIGMGGVPSYISVTNQFNYTGSIPLSLSMKESAKDTKGKKSKKGKEEEDNPESLPPNAVDKDGNILVTDYDILCGRGGLTNHHRGNKRFRDIVALHRPDYVRAPKIQKPSVARVIVRAIRNGDPPGRFLKKDEKTGKWVDIGDKKAAEKTSQALREKTGDEKEQTSTEAGLQDPAPIVPAPVTPSADQMPIPKVQDVPESRHQVQTTEGEVSEKAPHEKVCINVEGDEKRPPVQSIEI